MTPCFLVNTLGDEVCRLSFSRAEETASTNPNLAPAQRSRLGRWHIVESHLAEIYLSVEWSVALVWLITAVSE